MSTDKEILLQVHRHYSENEIMKHLELTIKNLQYQLGELRSERDELYYQLHHVRKQSRGEIRKDEYVKNILEINKRQQNLKNQYKKDCEEWRNKYLTLIANYEQRNTSP